MISLPFNLLLDNLTTAIILLNEQLQIHYMNSAGETTFLTSAQRSQGLYLKDLMIEKNEGISLQEILHKKQPYAKYNVHFVTNHGIEIIVDYMVTPIYYKAETFLLLEVKLLDELRIFKEDVLLSQQEGNKLLIRGLAHEIKNPLGGIRGAAQLLAQELPDESYQEYTNVLIEEADRLSSLVDRMLGSNKLPDFQYANIYEILEHVSSLTSAETRGKVAIVKDYDPSIPELFIDREQMIQAILNIVRNAIEALRESSTEYPQIILKTRILRQCHIGLTRYRLVLKIEIIDNGNGIPDHIKDSIFYPMVSGRPNGTGLGLAITQNIITRHLGTIDCYSQPGKTKFSILLPLE